VDTFIVLEGTHTFTGKPRRLEFEANVLSKLDMLPELRRKIRYIPVDMTRFEGNSDPWKAEEYLRNIVGMYLESDSDITICSDCDEIPSLRWISEIRKARLQTGLSSQFDDSCSVFAAEMLSFYGSCRHLMFDCNCMPFKWRGPFAACRNSFAIWQADYIRHQVARGLALESTKDVSFQTHLCTNGGWHLSYFGNSQDTLDKLDSFSHQEDEIKRHSANVYNSTRMGQDPFMRELHFRLPLPEELFPLSPSSDLNKELGYPVFDNDMLLLAGVQRIAEDSRHQLLRVSNILSDISKDIKKNQDIIYETASETNARIQEVLDMVTLINNSRGNRLTARIETLLTRIRSKLKSRTKRSRAGGND
jgi:beta-1,4-mannosyl-glycoprotein beta-1,4-N-acetylglucosaminyltransferase